MEKRAYSKPFGPILSITTPISLAAHLLVNKRTSLFYIVNVIGVNVIGVTGSTFAAKIFGGTRSPGTKNFSLFMGRLRRGQSHILKDISSKNFKNHHTVRLCHPDNLRINCKEMLLKDSHQTKQQRLRPLHHSSVGIPGMTAKFLVEPGSDQYCDRNTAQRAADRQSPVVRSAG